MILVDQFRLPIAVVLWVVIAVVGTWLGTLLTGIGILAVGRLLGVDNFFPKVSRTACG